MKKVIDEIKKASFIEILGLISSILTIITAITTLNILKTINKLSFDWIWAMMVQSTMYSIIISVYIAIIYFIYHNLNSLKKLVGNYIYIFIIPIFMIITLMLICGLRFIDIVHFVGYE